jgi:small subunit ribosomal protein S5
MDTKEPIASNATTQNPEAEVTTETSNVSDNSHARRSRDPKMMQKNSRKGGPRREPRAKPEFDQKIISIRRVTRVVTGGRRFAFSVAMVAGDRKGRVGVGIGKAGDTSLAIEKALRDAKKNMIVVKTTKDMSIPHDTYAKFCASRVKIMPAPGRGIIAGSSVRPVLELAGIKNCGAKLLSGSKNQINNARAAVLALSSLKLLKTKEHANS